MNNKGGHRFLDDFPVLNKMIDNHKLVYLDSGATSQKPQMVIDAVRSYNENLYGSIHRGAYYLSIMSTEKYELARETIKEWIHARYNEEIIFTRNTTEAINLVAHSYGIEFLKPNDEIVIAISEHHSNILPWQEVCRKTGAKLKYLYLNEEGRIEHDEIQDKITIQTKLVSVGHISNVLGVIHPVEKIIERAHQVGAVVLVDGAQAIPHIEVDVTSLDADFYVFSGHKMLASTGIGVLYGKRELLDRMPPFMLGGDMIEYVEEQNATYAPLPAKLEAGTQNVEGAISLAAAVNYLKRIGMAEIYRHEMELTAYALSALQELPYVEIYGPKDTVMRSGVISFNIKGVHPHDVATFMDAKGIAIRAGHHCAQPLMKYLNIPASCRISLYIYNQKEDIDIFIQTIIEIRKWFHHGIE